MVFLVLSGLFWLSTALNENYDYEIAVPVFVGNVPKNVIITSDVEDTLRVTVHDKGYAIMQYLYGGRINPITLNMPPVSKRSDKYVVGSTELLRMIRRQLYASSSVTSVKPERIEVAYCYGTAKKVAVRLDGDIMPAADYYLSHVQIVPEKVTVYAAKELLDSITYVMTEPLQVRNFADTVRTDVSLKTVKGARITPQKVRVELYPDILTEGTADVPITVVNVPENVNVRTFPSRVKVKFSVGVSQYRSINASQFLVEVDYNEIRRNTDKCPLHITRMPKGITKASPEFSEVDYLIEN